jgi:anaerobic magnesium-protoporphyrin IX monomethyl ester cyclase
MNPLKVLFVYPNCMMDNLIPVGASSVIGALRSAGVEVTLFDTTFHRTEEVSSDEVRVQNLQIPSFDYSEMGISLKEGNVYEEFRQRVEEVGPDIIMVSIGEATFQQADQLLGTLGNKRPFVLAGGIHAMTSPEEVIGRDWADALCIGEGEDSVVEFCERFRSGRDFSDIPGMWIKRTGEVNRNGIDHLVDLDAMPFLDFTLFEKQRFFKPMQGRIFKMVPIEFSRGCPYRCTYCVNHFLEGHFAGNGRFYRWKSMDRIFSEIDLYMKKYGAEFFYFVSETFLSMRERDFEEFCRRYKEYRVPFWFNTRPETITEKRLRMLEEVNCFRMGIGLEHGNEKFRESMLRRKVSNRKIVEACRLVENSKISYSVNNIIGFPGETRELIFDTIRLNREIHPNTVGTFVFTPFRGTDLRKYCVENGYLAEDAAAGDLNRTSVLENNTLSNVELEGLLRTFPLYVHFDEGLYPEIRKAEEFSEEGNRVFADLAKRYAADHFKR